MKKKLLSLVLLAGLILSTLTSCGASAKEEDDTTSEPAHMTTTITLTAITGASTTPEAIEKVQAAFNKLTKSEYKTQVIFQLKTEEEYVAYVEEQAKLIEERIKAEEEAAKKAKEEAKKKKEEEKLANANKKRPGKWNTTTKAETEDTAEETQEMTVDEFGRPVAKYPDLEGPSLDILFITGRDMLLDFIEKDYIQDISEELNGKFKILKKYIHPTILNAGLVESSTYAVPNNRVLGDYTYLLVDRQLADKYKFFPQVVKTLTDCEAFLDSVKANESGVIPMNEAVDLNYAQYVMDGERGLIGNVIKADYKVENPLIPKSMLSITSWINHNVLIKKMEDGGYFGEGDRYAIQVVKGNINSPKDENWEEKYYVIEYEKPIATAEVVYGGMFAVSEYASDVERCMEIISMLNTDGALRDIYAFGVEGENFEYNDDGSVHMLNDTWSMDFYHTGNTFVGSAPDTLPANYSEMGKLQNLQSLTGPYIYWSYLNEDSQAIYDEYIKEANKVLAGFDSAADRYAYAVDYTKKLRADTEMKLIVNKMLDRDGDDNFMVSYMDFHADRYGTVFLQ